MVFAGSVAVAPGVEAAALAVGDEAPAAAIALAVVANALGNASQPC